MHPCYLLFSLGAGMSQQHESHQHHMHQIDWSRVHKFNVTHTINSLSFGPAIPGFVCQAEGEGG
jgi:hypothetical protein